MSVTQIFIISAIAHLPTDEYMRLALIGFTVFLLVASSTAQRSAPSKAPLPAIDLALDLIKNKNFAEAERTLLTYLKKTPSDVNAKFLLGTLLIEANRADEGARVLEGVLKTDRNHTQANYNLALIYSSRGQINKAITYLERAAGITLQRKAPKTNDVILITALTRAYIAAQRKADAEKLIPLIEQFSSGDDRILFTLGLVQAELGHYERAAQIFEDVRLKRPTSTEVLYNLGIAYYNLDRFAEAQAVLLEAVRLNPNQPEFYYRLGLISSAQKDSDGAVSYWLRALESKKNFHEANFLIGEELLKNKKIAGSLPYYQRAAQLLPEKVLYQLRLGVAYFRLQQYGDARRVFDSVLRKYPNDPNFNYLQGYMARAEGLFDEALVSFRKVLKVTPNSPDVMASIGNIALERGDLVNAESTLRKTIELDPKNFPAYYDMGRLLIRQKKYRDALAILEKGKALNDVDPGIRYQLFIAYTRTNEKQKAASAFSEFKRLERIFNAGSGASTSADQIRDLPSSIETKEP